MWETKRVELAATVGQERAEEVFPFRNGGTKPVTITAIESSCGGTTARLTKSIYAPGEAGEVRALFEFEDRVGPQQKVLTVHTEDAKVATQLVLRVEIPETIFVEPRVLQSSANENGREKSLLVHTLAVGVEVTGLDFDTTKIDTRLEKISRSIYVDGSRAPGGTKDGASWATAYHDLTDALVTAQQQRDTLRGARFLRER